MDEVAAQIYANHARDDRLVRRRHPAGRVWARRRVDRANEASAAVLGVPELLENILAHLGDRREVMRVQWVATLWQAEAVRVTPRLPLHVDFAFHVDFDGGLPLLRPGPRSERKLAKRALQARHPPKHRAKRQPSSRAPSRAPGRPR